MDSAPCGCWRFEATFAQYFRKLVASERSHGLWRSDYSPLLHLGPSTAGAVVVPLLQNIVLVYQWEQGESVAPLFPKTVSCSATVQSLALHHAAALVLSMRAHEVIADSWDRIYGADQLAKHRRQL